MAMYPVSKRVGNVKNDDPEFILPGGLTWVRLRPLAEGFHLAQTVSGVISISVILAATGFVIGVVLGMAAFVLVVDERYRVWAARHPWIRLVSVLWCAACGAVAAFFAYRLAE